MISYRQRIIKKIKAKKVIRNLIFIFIGMIMAFFAVIAWCDYKRGWYTEGTLAILFALLLSFFAFFSKWRWVGHGPA